MITNSCVTLFRFNENTDEYENIGKYPAWVHKTEYITKDDKGARRHNTFDVRIELCQVADIEPDDMIFFGETHSTRPNITLCNRIASVTQNNFGTCPHWHIKSEERL